MNITLHRSVTQYFDSNNQTRTLTQIKLINEDPNSFIYSFDYENPKQYRNWLNAVKQNHDIHMNIITKKASFVVSKEEPLKSFYSISRTIYGDWDCRLIIPQINNKQNGRNLLTYAEDLYQVFELMNRHPGNDDFEIKSKAESEVFPLTDEGMIQAILKYGDL